jgi:hypothetical protein
MRQYIYIPGLGDKLDPLRRLALRRLRNRDSAVIFVPMNWSDKAETWEEKYSRVASAIDSASSDDIVVVGESAGGAIALYALSKNHDKKFSVITICGFNHGAADLHAVQSRMHPAFYNLMPIVDSRDEHLSSEQRESITTIYSLRDRTVQPKNSKIAGSQAIIKQTKGHFLSIAQSLLALGRYGVASGAYVANTGSSTNRP